MKQTIFCNELFELIQFYLSHVPDLLTTLQNLINQRELTDLTTSKSIYDQNDTDIDMTDRSLTELTTMNNDNHHVQQKRSTK
ncbi:unnamed protein product [Rotaria sp. Silwood1]|nr:unnamed protein product [Rotaria sp. Silwood1]CAF0919300.1 unnamed protein product [Rotaria sp. Silwood1]CAF0945482.1 unnamed protein product [Rotaria sp. Silwood1]CAF3375815.1 unnamed protein product [Rotaria sp. Silwood1]CAF3383738.1 unnamed protein product [Rotaria sp. Silwood1]